LDDTELVPVADVLQLPKRPIVTALVALVLLTASAIAAVIGVGHPPRTDLDIGAVTVQGQDPALDPSIALDLTRPIPIELRDLPADTEGADEVRLEFSVEGIPALPTRRFPLTRVGEAAQRITTSAPAQRKREATAVTAIVRRLTVQTAADQRGHGRRSTAAPC
jgi:hypothetical protein